MYAEDKLLQSAANASSFLNAARARAYAPRKKLTVSDWSDKNIILSRKTSPEPGPWRTDRNPILREPMDCLSARSPVHEVVLKFPIQMGKSEVGRNAIGYWMCEAPGPIMACFPAEVSMNKWINQKLNPLLEDSSSVRDVLVSTNTRNSANTKEFKDFLGGQLYVEHAGTPGRLKSTSVKYLVVDELTEFANALKTGDDPLEMLEDRYSAYSSSYKRLDISSPGTKGICRIDDRYEASDQRRYYMPCPHCLEDIVFEWSGLQWTYGGKDVVYVCPECACLIHEHQKTDMIMTGRWIPAFPGRPIRGYTVNCLYYQIGLGPRWDKLVEMWLRAQNDPAKLKTFINSRLAEAWEDPAMKKVQVNAIQDRAEPYRLRTAPAGVCAITAGVDTQDNRLAVHITGWGKHMAAWTLDYIELMGDPENDDVWIALIDLLNRPIEHVNGHLLPIMATAIDAGGHRTEAVKAFVRSKKIRRPLCIFGAVPNNAPVLSKGKPQDINFRGQYDKRGVMIHHVGTVGIKHKLFGRMATDHEKQPDARLLHFSEDLPPEYFAGIVSETFNPRTNRFDKKRGARNEPLDTLVYSYAAAHHPEVRLHLYTNAKWDELLAKYGAVAREEDRNVQTVLASAVNPPPAVKKPKRNSQLL
jgi:phage terminase large subunit GpA-like protein